MEFYKVILSSSDRKVLIAIFFDEKSAIDYVALQNASLHFPSNDCYFSYVSCDNIDDISI